jgi:anti-anti-sigma factor
MERVVMKMLEQVADDVTVLEAHGRVDSTTAKEFGDRLIALIQAGRRRIVVDFKNIAYISSAGFRALILADRGHRTKARQARALRSKRRCHALVRDRRFPRFVPHLPKPTRRNWQASPALVATISLVDLVEY